VKEGHEEPNRGRLPSAVGAEEAKHLTFSDLERDLVDATLAAVALGEIFNLDDR